MIPKIIHYCWVGKSPKPRSVLYCIDSWRKYCPDYEIIEWNESNYDFTKNIYMDQAYKAQKWGFVPDYARLDIIYEYGGIYLDTDVEMIRSIDDLLLNDAFFGFEDTGEGDFYVSCGLGFGSIKHNPLIKKLRDYYDDISFIDSNGSLNMLPAPRHNASIFSDFGVKMNNQLQLIHNNVFYPSEFLCPKIFKSGKLIITSNTYSIHHFTASWLDESTRKEINHNQRLCLIFGNNIGHKILFVESVLRKYGFWGVLRKVFIFLYEKFYQFYPLFIGVFFQVMHHGKMSSEIVLFDTSIESKNLGDQIIMENCCNHLREFFDLGTAIHISTHMFPAKEEINYIQDKIKVLCGTNILSGRMNQYGLWKLPRAIWKYRNTILLGVGFDSYNTKLNIYTKLLLSQILSHSHIHSVRDSFSEQVLRSVGISNVINTGCPTMWSLTQEFCNTIPHEKASTVVCTLTDYSRDEINDRLMLETLINTYKKVYLWLQGQDDLSYLNQLGYTDHVILIPSDLKKYDALLNLPDLDYVGTRLHAGIRALSKGHRTIIVAIDNRATCIHTDTGLPIIPRKDISLYLKNMIERDIITEISMPWDNIKKWKDQFQNRKVINGYSFKDRVFTT